MNVRKWDLKKDYAVICEWCKKNRWDIAFPEGVLPPKGIVVEEKEMICAAGLYTDEGSILGFMYGIFSNPDVSKLKLFKAMKMCVDEIYKLAKENNLGLVYTVTGEKTLHRLYERHLNIKCCENYLKSYIINHDEEKYNDFDWISEDRPDNLWGKNGKN